MICNKPFVKGGVAYGCGQCLPCRINKRRTWQHRILLEAKLHTQNSFITLTFTDEKLKDSSRICSTGYSSLNPKDLQDWLKRLRDKISPLRVRYFAVGEYGDVTQRPHYHVVLFGYPVCARRRTRRGLGSTRSDWANCCYQCRLIGLSWGHGDIELAELNEKTASYIAGYTTKKMTGKMAALLNGRHPEFARMSLRPGIGADATWQIASDLMASGLDARPDVPTALGHGKATLPLGRYLTRLTRKRIGKGENAPEETIEKIKAELQPLRETAFNASRSFASAIAEASEQPIRNMEAKASIFKKRVF